MRGPRLWMVLAGLGLSLAGCSGGFAEVQRNVDQTVMSTFIGRLYDTVTATPPELPLQPRRPPPYGVRFATTELPDGGRIHRHLIRSVGETVRTDFMGLATSRSDRIAYRLLYFRVDRSGLITDTANGFWFGETQRCVGYIGDIFRSCESPQALQADIVFFDTLVRTSQNRGIDAWTGAPASRGS